MATVDTGIYSMLMRPPTMEDVQERQLKAQQRAMQEQALRQQAATQQQAAAAMQELKALYANTPRKDLPGVLLQRGYAEQALKLEKEGADVAKSTAEAASKTYDTAHKRNTNLRERLTSAQADPALSYGKLVASAMQYASDYGIDPDVILKQLNPLQAQNPDQLRESLRQWMQGSMTGKDQMELTQQKPLVVGATDRTEVIQSNPNAPGYLGTLRTIQNGVSPSKQAELDLASRGVVYHPNPQTGVMQAFPTSAPSGATAMQVRSAVTADGAPVYGGPAAIKAADDTKKAGTFLERISKAESLLPKATGSGAGAIRDSVQRFVGVETNKNAINTELANLGAWMASSVPRMEGPQSDADRRYYEEMAGKVGDSTYGVQERLETLKGLRELMERQKAAGNAFFGGAPKGQSTPQATPQPAREARPNGLSASKDAGRNEVLKDELVNIEAKLIRSLSDASENGKLATNRLKQDVIALRRELGKNAPQEKAQAAPATDELSGFKIRSVR